MDTTIEEPRTKHAGVQWMTQEQRKEFETRVFLKDPYMMGKYLFGYDKFGENQRVWARWIMDRIDPHPARRKGVKLLIMQPRGTYKTTFFTETVSAWLHANDIYYGDGSLCEVIGNERYANAADFLRELKGQIVTGKHTYRS